MADLTGQRLGRYLIEEKLGEGGMAVVYRAADERLGRSVAVKVIRVEMFPAASVENMLRRFDREARALARLTHANIVGVIDYGDFEGAPYLVMEYLPGGSLKDRLGVPQPVAPSARLAAVIAGALDYAHSQGIVHRDVKPSNILLTASGDPMLSDFGIAKLLDLDERSNALTSSGMAIGTPEYMAPEQWMGNTSPASDQYSLGLILYELVTGRKPYTASTPGELLIKQHTEPLPRPREFIRDFPLEAERVIVKALAREPQERYPDMKAFSAALESLSLIGQVSILSQPPVSSPRPVSAGKMPAPPPASAHLEPRAAAPQPRPVTDASAPEGKSPPGQPSSDQTGSPAAGQPAGGRRAVAQASSPAAQPAALDSSAVHVAAVPGAAAPGAAGPGEASQAAAPASGSYPSAPARRSPLPWLAGGLLAFGLLAAVVIAGVVLVFFLSGWPGQGRATPTPLLSLAQTTTPGPIAPGPTAVLGQEATPANALVVPTAAFTGTLRVNLESFPDTLDPQKASYVGEVSHLRLVYEALTRLNEKLETVPGAAEKWEYNSDATRLTFTLRQDLKYSDGSLLNAKRFEYVLLRNIDPATQGEYASITDEILGAPEYRGADPAKTSTEELLRLRSAVGVHALDLAGQPCSGYDQPDCRVLRLDFSRPAPYFHTAMSIWAAFPAKEELISQGGADWWKTPANLVGNGPFILDSLDSNTYSLYTPNPHYWRGVSRVDIEYHYIDPAKAFKSYQDGDLDIISPSASDLASARADSGLKSQVMFYPGSCTYNYNFQLRQAPFNDIAVRQAFAYAFDREAWVNEVLEGLGSATETWIPKGIPGYDPNGNSYSYSPAAAITALKYAGYKISNGQLTKDGKTFSITLTYSDTDLEKTRSEWIAKKWKADLGLDVKQNPVSSTDYDKLFQNPDTIPQFYVIGWCADYPDPSNWLSVYWKSSSSFAQRYGFADDRVDKLLEQADSSLDEKPRMELYVEAQRLILSDVPGIPVWNSVNAYLVKPNIKGIIPTALDADWPGSIDPLAITAGE